MKLRRPRPSRSDLRRRLQLETLEHRQLLAGDLAGTIYSDLNQNGIRDGGESGVAAGWRVFVDTNRDGLFSAGEPSGLTNKDGDYAIAGVAPGIQRVVAELQTGWRATTPATQDVTIQDQKTTNKVDFFAFAGGSISGVVWNDLNGDGTRDQNPDTGEFTDPGLSGWVIYLDLDASGQLDPGEPQTLTDADGAYNFSDLPEGDYEVTEELPSGWEATKKNDTKQTATVVPLQNAVQDFGNFSLTNGSISGTVWNDVNGDGDRAKDAATGLHTEPGLAGWTVFIDQNANGTLDASELSVVTDVNGDYRFVSLPEGSYQVRELLPSSSWSVSPGFTNPQLATVTAGENTNNIDFANFTILNGAITGTIWNDLNRDGLRNYDLSGKPLDPGLADWTVVLDLNRNGVPDATEPTATTDVDGVYLFSDLQIGEYEIIEQVKTGWETAPGFGDNQTARVYSGATTTAGDFANFNLSTLVPGSVAGTIWNDDNSNGLQDATESGLSGWTVYADVNNNFTLDASEPQATTDSAGGYVITGINPGSVAIREVTQSSWRPTAPLTASRAVNLKNGENLAGINFGNQAIKDAELHGRVFNDANKNGILDSGERGLSGITVYLDLNGNSALDPGEPSTTSSDDLFFTPSIDESGNYSFTHLAVGDYQVRQILPVELSATPASELSKVGTAAAVSTSVNFADRYRANEIHGVRFDDLNHNSLRDADEPALVGTQVYIDLNRNNTWDAGEPETTTGTDGSYTFTELVPGAYVVREVPEIGRTISYPDSLGGVLWPSGTSHPAVGNVTPDLITLELADGQSHRQNVSITLPGSGGLTNMVDVFLLFDDTGSFVNNSPIVRGAFPTIISELQTALPGMDLGFGVGRFEEYANFASEYSTGRPFVLNQPIVASSTSGYMAAIQSALNRTTPGYGGDQPETDIEALYQLVTGLGFDGNDNGTVTDSGAAGLASTQLNPGSSGDVPSFASFTADTANGVLQPDGSVGGGGFRAGALPVILLATDTGFAYQPKGETSITGVGGLSLPISSLTGTSRSSTPFSSGAGIQETITALNALGALVIGLGTNAAAGIDPRQGLEAISKLTGATNQSSTTIANGTTDPIAPGDPLYFQIASGFAGSVSNGVINAIQNAVTNVAMNITIKASDPRVHIINHTGTVNGVKGGETASFDIEFVGDGIPHRFDLQFVREGTDVVLGSIPVVIGTPIPGDGYHFEDLDEGEIDDSADFGDYVSSDLPVNSAPSFTPGTDVTVEEDAGLQTIANWATNISAGPASETWQTVTFTVSSDNPSLFQVQPSISPNGALTFQSNSNAFGSANLIVSLRDNGGTANGGVDTSSSHSLAINVTSVNDAPTTVGESYILSEGGELSIVAPGVLSNDSDIEGDTLTARLVASALHGTVVLNPDGSFAYTPDLGYSGADSFSYVANDGALDSNAATVQLIISGVNHAPVAKDDIYSVLEDESLSISLPGVLGNDTDIDDNVLNARLVDLPIHGSVSLGSDGSFVYTPDANFNGTDQFTYVANDGSLDSNLATVVITVQPQNDAPVAGDDTYTTTEDVPLVITGRGVLANDTDVDGDLLTAILGVGPAHGTLALNSEGSFVYTPDANFNGTDQFTYVANDGSLDSNLATVVITVQPQNDAPVAGDDTYTTTEDVPLVITGRGVLANDTDVDGDLLTAILGVGPAHGTLALNSEGSFVYTPDANFNGTDQFTYVANDGSLDSNLAIVVITVQPQNDAPVANDDNYSATEDVTLRISAPGLIGNDADVDGDLLAAVLVSGPTHGSLLLNADGSFEYTPNANFNGTDSFSYKVNDGAADSNIAVVTINVASVNDAPKANGDAYTTSQGALLQIAAPGVLVNDSDVDGDALSALVVGGPANGTLTLNADGSFSYLPDPGFSGQDSFTYQVTDGIADSNTAVVTITVQPVVEVAEYGFLVVDQSRRRFYEYDGKGVLVGNSRLDQEDQTPRGVASSLDGAKRWVVDSKGEVFVYDANNQLIGSWEMEGVDKPEGIAVSGNDLWIVDRGNSRRIAFFAGAALRESGKATPSSTFRLARANSSPMDIATDGKNLWVVDDGNSSDAVFVYSVDGTALGSWQIDVENSKPTGIALAVDTGDLWIVDSESDSAYLYSSAASLRSGAAVASSSLRLNSSNGNSQGIAIVPHASPAAMSMGISLATPLPGDVNDDGLQTPVDALLVINYLNDRSRSESAAGSSWLLDVNADGNVTASDALTVINELATRSFERKVSGESSADWSTLENDLAIADLFADDHLLAKRS